MYSISQCNLIHVLLGVSGQIVSWCETARSLVRRLCCLLVVMFIWFQNVAAGASRQSAAKMTNDIMHGMYSSQYMATHCLTGNEKEDKGALPSTDVTRIIG